MRESLAELGCHHDARSLVAVCGDYGTGIVRSAVPNAAEPALAHLDVRLKHLCDRFAEREVCVAGYGCVDIGMHIGARGGFFSDCRDELGLAEGLHVLGAVGAVHGRAFEEDGADDVVPGSEVAQQVVEHVVVARSLPEVVVRVADGQVGVDGVFGCELEPVFAWGDHGGASCVGLLCDCQLIGGSDGQWGCAVIPMRGICQLLGVSLLLFPIVSSVLG